MKITEWLDGFLVRHARRHPRPDWPQPGSQTYERLKRNWLDAMLAMQPRPKEAEADRASLAIHGDAIDWLEDHPQVLSQAITVARQAKGRTQPANASQGKPGALPTLYETPDDPSTAGLEMPENWVHGWRGVAKALAERSGVDAVS